MGLFGNLLMPIGEKPKEGWIKWFHFGVPDKEGEKREKARKDLKKLRHCEKCTVLSGDYFPSFNMPQYRQHYNCDCKLFLIAKPSSQAVADCALAKFTKYIFGEKYKDNGKIKLFKDLGFKIEDSEYLKSEFDRQARQKYLSGAYILGELDKYGQRITIEINLKSPIKDNIILKRVGWCIL